MHSIGPDLIASGRRRLRSGSGSGGFRSRSVRYGERGLLTAADARLLGAIGVEADQADDGPAGVALEAEAEVVEITREKAILPHRHELQPAPFAPLIPEGSVFHADRARTIGAGDGLELGGGEAGGRLAAVFHQAAGEFDLRLLPWIGGFLRHGGEGAGVRRR